MTSAVAGKIPVVLVVDVGGTHVKILAMGQRKPRKIQSGPNLTPRRMVHQVKKEANDWAYNAVSIGYPGPVINGRLLQEPRNAVPALHGSPQRE